MILYTAFALVVGAVGYAIKKHITLAQVKAEVVKIEGEIVSGTLVAEVKAGYAAIIARIKALL